MKDEIIIYIGCYAQPPQSGIYVCHLDTRSSEMTEIFSSNAVSNPSYLALSTDKKRLYTVMEDEIYQGKAGGGAAAFNIIDNSVSLINTAGTGGTTPCHVLIDEKNNFLFTSNYNGGSVSMLPLNSDGSLSELSELKQHTADGKPNAVPHLHFSQLTPDGTALHAVDLGLDIIKYYEIDIYSRRLIGNPLFDIHLPVGTGPRHFVSDLFNSDILYVVCELSSEIIAVNRKSGKIIQRISTLENETKSYCGAIKLSADGRFLYVSNRGDDSIAVFSINKGNNPLSLIQFIKTQGEYPRDLWLCDSLLLSANQKSGTVTAFCRNNETGKLSFLKTAIELTAPVCIIS